MTKNQSLRTYCRGLQIAALNYGMQTDYKPLYETRDGILKQTHSIGRNLYKCFLQKSKRGWQPVVLVPCLSFQISPFFLMHYLLVYHFFSPSAFHCFFWINLRCSLQRFISLLHANSFPLYLSDVLFFFCLFFSCYHFQSAWRRGGSWALQVRGIRAWKGKI